MSDFELPEPGEGVQNVASDFILREFTNSRLFEELKEGSFEKMARTNQWVEEDYDF